MDKKLKFSDQPRRVKIVYSAVIALLCITAAAVGVVSSMPKEEDLPIDQPTGSLPEPTPTPGESELEGPPEDEKQPEKQTFISPLGGEITKKHSLDTPVFSDTLAEWRVHSGIDIAAEEGSEVLCSSEGTVARVYSDPFLGRTVEVDHGGGIVSVYSNLAYEVGVREGDEVTKGEVIGLVGDTSLLELSDEGHLHFEIKLNGVSVDPLDYIFEKTGANEGEKL